MTDTLILPVILCGGSGLRLWPLSRPQRPKQFLPLDGGETLLRRTLERTGGPGFAAPVIITGADHRFMAAEEARRAGFTGVRVIVEPEGRNTAPAAAVAALVGAKDSDDPLILLAPSDHIVKNPDAFRAAVGAGAEAALAGRIVTFGVTPSGPHTGYGYIKRGPALAAGSAAGSVSGFSVERFTEKPDKKTAEGFLAEGGYDWNAGIFLFRASVMVDEMARLAPETLAAAESALQSGEADGAFFHLGAEAFARAPKAPLDTAVMEKTDKAAVVPVDMGWTDAGSWAALRDISAPDSDGNVTEGPVHLHGVSGSYVRSDGVPLGVAGLKDVAVIASEDGVLAAPLNSAESVRALAELAEAAAGGAFDTATVRRPWGGYKTLKAGESFQVKHIFVRPGGKLSLQYHNRRAEHWVVAAGTARVQKGDEVFDLNTGESVSLPVGVKHRLENPGEETLELIEVQFGDYLGRRTTLSAWRMITVSPAHRGFCRRRCG
ncbi:MAG: mannose-1-phosphate guanylyltransferase/mannose-6-phosphate isomerase [Rhodospirillales bacterium]